MSNEMMEREGGRELPSEEEIMMAGMIALGLVAPPNQGQPQMGGQAPEPMPAQPMPQDDPKARIAAQLMK